MNQLTQDQKDHYRNSMANNNFSPQIEILKLVAEGYDIEVAKGLVIAEIKAYKKEVFDKTVARNNQSELRKFMPIVVFLVAMIGPVFGVESPFWYIVAIILVGTAGYFAYRDKPVAGVMAYIIAAMAFPFTYSFYFAERSTYMKIEMLIPMLMAAIPAIIVYYIISAIAYS